MKLQVKLNGTATNPFARYGLKQNPFPQIAEYEYSAGCLQVQKLGGEPIPHDRYEEYIRDVLSDFSEEFVNLCVSRFKPGEMVEFDVTF